MTIRREEGFTVIEVLVAALILVIGILAALQALDSSRRLTLVAERQTTIAHRAQAELERVKSLSYSQIGLTGTSSSWASSASSYTGVNNPPGSCPPTGSAPTYQPDHRSGGSTATEPLVINGCAYMIGGASTAYTTGTVTPVSSWSNGPYSGNVYDFITWTSDPTCSQTTTPGSYCSTSNDYKRITVVATLTGATHPSNPAIVSGYVADPSQNSAQNVSKSPTTTCTDAQGQTGSCSTPVIGVPVPNVLCDASYQSGCGQPACTGNNLDKTLVSSVVNLLTTPPIPDAAGSTLPTGSCPTPPSYGLDQLPGGQGLPITPSGNPTCGSGPPLDNTKSHSWVGPSIPTGSKVNLTGSGAMTTFVESPTGVAVNATLCLHLYVVANATLGTLGNLLSTPIGATVSADVTAAAGVPTPVTFNFSTGAASSVSATLGPVRIEFVVWVAGAASTVEMVYDQSQFASEITLMTQ